MVKYFHVFSACVAASIAGLVAGMLLPGAARITFSVFALMPLVYYHLWFLRPRVRATGDVVAADSVYYYGFLLTVAALGAAALSINLGGTVDFQPVLVKFGIGVIATGYAVFARIHLISSARNSELGSAEQHLERYVRRTQALVDDVEVAIVRIREFSETVLRESGDLHKRAQREIEERMLHSASVFQAELSQILPIARETLGDTRALINDLTFEAERSDLRKTISQTASTARKLDKAMEEFAGRFDSGTAALTHAAGALTAVGQSADSTIGSLEALGGPNGAIEGSARALSSATSAAQEAALAARAALADVNGVGRTLAGAGQQLTELSASALEVTRKFQELSPSADRLQVALSQFAEATSTAESTARKLAFVAETFPGINVELESIGNELAKLREAVGDAVEGLESDVQRSAAATTLLIRGLTDVADGIIRATRTRQGLT